MGGFFFFKKTILNSVQFECKDNHGQKKNFENSLRSPSSFQKNVLIGHKSVLLKSELHTGQTGILPYETRSAVAALQNGFKKRCRIAAKRLAAAVANFGCSGQRYEAV